MKRSIFTLIALMFSTLASAQSYGKLWKQVYAAMEDDLPQTALQTLGRIESKAATENNAQQLLRAMTATYRMQKDVSPDSAGVAMQRMERYLGFEKRPVEHAIWQSVLGQLCVQNAGGRYYYSPRDTAMLSRGRELLRASIADMHLLGQARAKAYKDLFELGADSRYYAGDLLSPLVHTVLSDGGLNPDESQKLRRDLADYYRAHGNRQATLLSELDLVRNTPEDYVGLTDMKRYQRLRALATEYRDLSLNVETYIALTELRGFRETEQTDSLLLALAREGLGLYPKEKRAQALRAFIEEKETPMMTFSLSNAYVYPGSPQTLKVHARHMKGASVHFYRTPYTAEDVFRMKDGAWKDKYAGTPSVTIRKAFEERPAYVWFDEEIAFAADTAGVYIVEVKSSEGPRSRDLLYVTGLRPMLLVLQGGHGRVTAVDARSGAPIPGSRLHAVKWNSEEKKYEDVKTFHSDADGDISIELDEPGRCSFFLSAGTDRYLPKFDYSAANYFSNAPKREHVVRVYTDRGIYRPGQKVEFGAIAYEKDNDDVRVKGNKKYVATLLDSNDQQLDTLHLVSDDFGVLGGAFTLPDICMPGVFTIRVAPRLSQSTYYTTFRVEEYKRPTFSVELLRPTVAYKLGDSLVVEGEAKTFTGLPVKNASVRYDIRNAKRYAPDASTFTDNGETTTDDEGRFRIHMLLKTDEGDTDYGYWWSWREGVRFISLSADVTAQNGETQQASTSFVATKVADWIETEWPSFICRETPRPVVIRHMGSGGRLLPDGGRYEILRRDSLVVADTFHSGRPFQLPVERLGSGQYKVRIHCGEREDRTVSFTLISEQDRLPFGDEKLCHYERLSTQGDSAFVMVGSPLRDVTLFCDIVSQGSIVESRRYHVSNELLHLNFNYKPEYGEKATVHLAFLRDGNVHSTSFTLEKPRPDKRLMLSWSTFRSLLRPGQHEEWRLRVSHPDGSPAEASLMACLYDASLDQLAANPWQFALSFPRFNMWSAWQSYYVPGLYLASSLSVPYRDVPPLQFTTWSPRLFLETAYGGYGSVRVRGSMKTRAKANAAGAAQRLYATAAAEAADGMFLEEVVVGYAKNTTLEDDAAPEANDNVPEAGVEVRTNFAETAYFQPALRTDNRGEVSLVFTLPESLTSWQFRALAHDRTVRYGMLDTVVIARKDFMVEGNLPRFVRQGDRATLPATIRNLSDATESGTLTYQVLDAATGRLLIDGKQGFTLQPGGEETFAFSLQRSDLPAAIIVRFTAKGRNFSDGEERLLPVLSARERVLRTVPFSINQAGELTLGIDTLFSSSKNLADAMLSVETSSNPAWYAVAELPVIANYECYSATSWATRYYALSLARHIGRENPEIRGISSSADKQHAWADLLKRNPDLKQVLLQETPWVAEAEDESARVNALVELFDETKQQVRMRQTLLELDKLQTAEGAWTWFPGMQGNPWITTEVALLLARQQVMTGDKGASDRLQRAMMWLEMQTAEDVKNMKKAERKAKEKFSISEQKLKYLYLRALLGMEADKDTRFLLKRFSEPAGQTMFEKAMTVVVQNHFGMEKEALTGIKSLLEHTVSTEAMGRYFDTDRALWCWNSYKMPTQTAAIEALYAMRDKGDFASVIEDMKLWVIQSKRTQDWNMLRATTDAIYCLLLTSARPGAASPLEASAGKQLTYELLQGKRVVGRSDKAALQGPTSIGYARADYTDAAALKADRIHLTRRGEGLAWGAVFAQFTLTADEIGASASGLGVSRRLEVRRGQAWVPIADGEKLHVGDRLRQVFTLTADRDYDFVSLRASRAACMEPVDALSGYTYRDGQSFYRVVRDASNEYFFETFRKGTHTFTEETFVDRAGRYTLGTAKVQSQYAPEFCGQTAGDVIVVE